MDALMTAICRRGTPRALMHYSDRGNRYTKKRFQALLAEHGIEQHESVRQLRPDYEL